MVDPEKTGQWQVVFTSYSAKQAKRLTASVKEKLARLMGDLEQGGPIQKDWSHFGALKKGKSIPENSYHCHIRSGRPVYVVCWVVEDKKKRVIEVYYVGTHENAPY